MKKTVILASIFFLLIYSAYALKTFEIEETELLSLAPEAEDPDQDKLQYIFSEPLNESGEWQTTYQDEGQYNITIIVTDGENEVSEEVSIIVTKKEEEPTIDSFVPEEQVSIDEGKTITFLISASDLNNDELTYEWEVDGEVFSESNEFVFETGYKDAGEYEIIVTISDGNSEIEQEWDLEVLDVDINAILESIEDITVLETKTAKLTIPDLKKLGLTYEISEPLSDNRWKTDYDDAGEYEIYIDVYGKDYEGEKTVKVTVEDLDRAAKFIGLRDVDVRENEELVLELKAEDADGDKILFSIENTPEGAVFENNVLKWTPGFNYVNKENFMDYFVDKFKILGRTVKIRVFANSNELSTEKEVKINVKDSNRPFELKKIEDIEINEGEDILIEPTYTDPDRDKVVFSYSGFMSSNTRKTSYDDAGEYYVKVVATDGFYEQTRFVKVKVNNINRKPEFQMQESFTVVEGTTLEIELNAVDEDNDEFSYTSKLLPVNSELTGNAFTFSPEFTFVTNATSRDFNLKFGATDGKDSNEIELKISVINKNQAPEIITTSDDIIAFVDIPIIFEVTAEDIDKDELSYAWDFGFLDKFEGINQHERIFTSAGTKKVSVIVSDGLEEVSKEWIVEVI
ncbi:hypothetical protein ISS07_06715 [Candidatus Woesearchaeota archaeon]|nr:hypothetical protein [Candidatus Woesearchaeota archaeon]